MGFSKLEISEHVAKSKHLQHTKRRPRKLTKTGWKSYIFLQMYMIYQDNGSWKLLTFLVVEILLWKVFALACDRQEQPVVLPNMKDNSVCLWSTVNSLYTNESCQKQDEKVRYFFFCFFSIFFVFY